MTTANAEDRRHHSRITFHTAAHLVVGNRRIPARVLDLSLKGALVQLPDSDQRLGAEANPLCQLEIDLDDAESDRICMKVGIAHARQGRIGLLCQDIDLDSITHLRRLVELNLGDPALLERELSALIAD